MRTPTSARKICLTYKLPYVTSLDRIRLMGFCNLSSHFLVPILINVGHNEC